MPAPFAALGFCQWRYPRALRGEHRPVSRIHRFRRSSDGGWL